MPYLTRSDSVWTLYLGTEGVELDAQNPENRFHPDWIAAVEEQLDRIEADDEKTAVVLTATGKFFSNGLDVDYIGANADKLPQYLDQVHALYRRLLTFSRPIVAAVNGHAFGAGAMLVLCAEHRIMRTERGFWSLPEILLGMPFTDPMSALLRTRLPDATATEAMTTGRRYGAAQAQELGIVEQAVDVDSLLTIATAEAANRAAVAGPALATIKSNLRGPLLQVMSQPTPPL
jgi:enoyl-CoA hydratase/carnithine racemase